MWKNILFLILSAVFGFLLIVAIKINTRPITFGETPTARMGITSSTDGANTKPKRISPNEIERLNLQKDLTEEIDSLGVNGNVSLYYKNLEGDYEVEINAERPWIPASMVKAYIVIEAYRQKRLRVVNFDSRVTIKKENVVPTELEAQEYQPLRAGVKATIRELIEAMIAQSDNTAYNTLLDIFDRRNISATLRDLGLNNTVVGEKLSLSDEQYAQDTLVPGRQLNTTTVRDFGHLFTLLYEGKIEDSSEILTIFKRQKIGSMIPALLPKGVEIAHKTGTWSPYYHDGGIIYKVDEPFVLVVFTNNNDPNVVAKLAKITYYKTRDVLGVSITTPYGKILELTSTVRDAVMGVIHVILQKFLTH